MDYEKILDLSQVTIQDCLNLYNNGLVTVINDGVIINFMEEQYVKGN